MLSLIAMMALAFVMSLCSESDAFVAASFTAFGPAPSSRSWCSARWST